jgi:alkylation response protein AidB-like acyl-CoA dehydrogenase
MIAMSALTNERGFIGSAGRGITKQLGGLIAFAKADGRTLSASQRQRLAELYSRGRAYLHMVERQGPAASVNSSLGKLGMTLFSFDMAQLRVDIAGPEAMLIGDASGGLLAAPGGWFGGGTSQVQRNIIGERILGLPREPRPG